MSDSLAADKGQNATEFDRESFLNRGSIFAFENKVWLLWGEPIFSDKRPNEPAFCSCSFFLENSLHWQKHEKFISCSTQKAIDLLTSHDEVEQNQVLWEEPSMSSFSEQFHWIMESIKEDKIKKAVPYVIESGQTKNGEAPNLQQMLVQGLLQEKGFLYGYWEQGKGRLGRTPEILIEQKSKSEFKTMAVAGTTTLENFRSSPQSFLDNKKENEEHDWVVQDICEVLKNYGDVVLGQRTTLATPHLVHLQTEIDLNATKETSIENLVHELHPTPALGVFPREKNKEVLGQLNLMSDRGEFGAPFGFSINEEESVFVVAIRSVEWAGSDLFVVAGCGVVEASELEKEWEEVTNKRNSIKKMFGLA